MNVKVLPRAKEADTLVIADVWDTRREPKNLMQNL